MTPDLLRTVRWVVLAVALVVAAIACRPQVHVYLHHTIELVPARR